VPVSALMEKLGYQFKDAELLHLALSHKSHANELARKSKDDPNFSPVHNERLEFLGDSVLGLIITDLLYENFADANEGKLSKVRSILVRAETLSEIAREIGLGKYVFLGKGEITTGGADKESILSSTYEAVLGALYLDGGLEAAYAAVEKHFRELLPNAMSGAITKDYKTGLQELSQRRYRQSPDYKVTSESGPDHEKTFEVQVKIGNHEFLGRGRNKKEAEQAAARDLLTQLHSEEALPTNPEPNGTN
jgi:ribonuclease III